MPQVSITVIRQLVFYAVAYFLLGALGLSLATYSGYSSPVFPASGLALAAILIHGRRLMPAVFAGSMALNVSLSLFNGMEALNSLGLAFSIATGATIQATCGAWLVQRFAPRHWERFDNEKSTFIFLVLGGVLACGISASFGLLTMLQYKLIGPGQGMLFWWTWYIGDTIGVFLLAPYLIIRDQRKGRLFEKHRVLTVSLVASFSVAVGAFFAVGHWEVQNLKERVADIGGNIERHIESRTNAQQEILASLARLLEVNPDITEAQFEHFTHVTLTEEKDIFALSFNPLITGAERPAFEQKMRGLLSRPDFHIKQRTAEGLVMAGDSARYVPVAYISPLAPNLPALGFDIHSNNVRRQAIEQALATREVAITAPVKLVQENQERVATLVLEPVFSSPADATSTANEGTQKIIGFSVAVLKVDEMIEMVAEEYLPKNINLNVYDSSGPEGVDLPFMKNNFPPASDALKEFSWTSTIKVADRNWTIELQPETAFLEGNRSLSAWAVGVVGFFFAVLGQVMLMGMSGRSEMVRRQVEEQTHYIKEQQGRLLRATKEARAANEAKSRFLATMSHELRIPLNGILGIAKLIQMEDKGGHFRDKANTILKSGEVLLTLLNDLLDLAKVEAGKLELRSQHFDAARLMADIQTLYEGDASSKGLNLQADWQGPSPLAQYKGDATRLRQILGNLVSNAIKFTASGSIHVSGKEIESDNDQATLRFEVKDTGIGVSEEQQNRLFLAFSQIDDSYSRTYGGTGLGLSIVKSLSELMDGEVGVESEAGQGSTFWFTVKLNKLNLPNRLDEISDNDLIGALENQEIKLQGEVLVAEDDAVNRTVIGAFLKKLGLNYSHATNGKEVLTHLQTGKWPDLILMDLHMPEMDGYTATEEVRKMEIAEGREHIPIIALTAAVFADEKAKCMEVGMTDFLAKPISFEKFAVLLERRLRAIEQKES